MQPGSIVERGVQPCLECGTPHFERVVEMKDGKIYKTSWATEGHVYRRMSWEMFAKQLLAERRRLKYRKVHIP